MAKNLFGFMRGRVQEVDIPEFKEYGAVRIWFPDLHTDLDPDFNPDSSGLITYPANNPIGGRNDTKDTSYGGGVVYVPRVGEWMLCFFEQGDLKKPFYLCALNIFNTKLPPEQRVDFNGGSIDEPHSVYTIIRSHNGRSIVVADSDDVQRIEITGKKRTGSPATEPAAENQDSNYHIIDGNQTTILFDERTGKEKVLIRTRLGDFLHIDVDERRMQAFFKEDIRIQTDHDLHLKVKNDVHMEVGNDLFIKVKNDKHLNVNNDIKDTALNNMHIKANSSLYEEAGSEINQKSGGGFNMQAGGTMNEKAGGNVNIDGSMTNEQTGAASGASGATQSKIAKPIEPVGKRET